MQVHGGLLFQPLRHGSRRCDFGATAHGSGRVSFSAAFHGSRRVGVAVVSVQKRRRMRTNTNHAGLPLTPTVPASTAAAKRTKALVMAVIEYCSRSVRMLAANTCADINGS